MPGPHLISSAELEAFIDQIDPGERPEGVAPVAVFDADETLWRGDVGEHFFHWFVAEGRVHEAAAPRVAARLTDWGIACDARTVADGLRRLIVAYDDGQFQGLESYALMVQCMAGHREQEVAAWTAARVGEYLPGRVYDFMARTIGRLTARGISCYIVSASSRWSVEAGAAFVDVAVARARGVDLERIDDRLDWELREPAPLGPGKVHVMDTLFAGRPLLAFGDSRWDLPMLRKAVHPVLIKPKQSVLELLGSESGLERWRVVG